MRWVRCLIVGLRLTNAASVEVGFVVTNSHCEVDSILGLLLGLQLTIRGYVIVTDCHCGGGSDFKFIEWVYNLLRCCYGSWVCSNWHS